MSSGRKAFKNVKERERERVLQRGSKIIEKGLTVLQKYIIYHLADVGTVL